MFWHLYVTHFRSNNIFSDIVVIIIIIYWLRYSQYSVTLLFAIRLQTRIHTSLLYHLRIKDRPKYLNMFAFFSFVVIWFVCIYLFTVLLLFLFLSILPCSSCSLGSFVVANSFFLLFFFCLFNVFFSRSLDLFCFSHETFRKKKHEHSNQRINSLFHLRLLNIYYTKH